MASMIPITCPDCKKQSKGPAELLGKRIRCKACGHTFLVEADAGGKAAPEARPPQAKAKGAPQPQKAAPPIKMMDDDDDPNPYGVTDLDLSPRCPNCANELEAADSVICLYCGYNTITRQLGATRKVYQTTGGEHFMWLLPGLLCVLGIIVLMVADLVYCLMVPNWVGNTWAEFTDHESLRLWTVILSLGIIWGLGYFAFRRLIMEPAPPEKVKG
jgi:DNA-directed RNA polymerase subunit RPC12/RpoP